MSKPTQEATNNVMMAVAMIQADATGQYIADVINIFGEVESQHDQIENAKLTVLRFAEAYCK